jgi:hypothetical protein
MTGRAACSRPPASPRLGGHTSTWRITTTGPGPAASLLRFHPTAQLRNKGRPAGRHSRALVILESDSSLWPWRGSPYGQSSNHPVVPRRPADTRGHPVLREEGNLAGRNRGLIAGFPCLSAKSYRGLMVSPSSQAMVDLTPSPYQREGSEPETRWSPACSMASSA